MNDYIRQTDKIFFKHEISSGLSCDTYNMHTHNNYELIYFVGGNATHVIEDRKYKLRRGDLILIRPFRYHFIQIDAPEDYERYDILFDPERHGISGLSLIPDDVEIINIAGNGIAEDIFRRCDTYRRSCAADDFAHLLPHLLSELFYNVSLFSLSPAEEAVSVSPLISEALRYINENLNSIGGTREIAEHLFISESYLFRLFRKELHQTPKKYIMDKRLLTAQKRLASGASPTSVCESCGFADYTTFYRNYTSFFGHAPSKEKQ